MQPTKLFEACLWTIALGFSSACGVSNSEQGPLAAGSNNVFGSAGAGATNMGFAGVGTTGFPQAGTTGTIGGGTAGVGSVGGGTAGVGSVGGGTAGTGTTIMPGTGSECTATQTTEGRLTTIDVTWPGTAAVVAGSGKVYAWTLWNITYSGNTATAQVASCGAVLPQLPRQAILGGGNILIEYPTDIWDLPNVPKATVEIQFGSQTSDAQFMSSIYMVTGAMLDASAAWPMTGAELQVVDVEGDGHPGFTATPRDGNGFQLPPTSLLGSQHADKLYLAIRNAMTTTGQRTSCDEHSGTVAVSAFDNHIVGCRIKETQAECAAADAKFIDDNRTKLMPASASYVAKVIATGATCADVRAMFPVQ